jgi:hypothetical protein
MGNYPAGASVPLWQVTYAAYFLRTVSALRRHQPYKSRIPRPASISAEVQRKNSEKGWAVCHSRTTSVVHKAASSQTVATYNSGYRLKRRNMANG